MADGMLIAVPRVIIQKRASCRRPWRNRQMNIIIIWTIHSRQSRRNSQLSCCRLPQRLSARSRLYCANQKGSRNDLIYSLVRRWRFGLFLSSTKCLHSLCALPLYDADTWPLVATVFFYSFTRGTTIARVHFTKYAQKRNFAIYCLVTIMHLILLHPLLLLAFSSAYSCSVHKVHSTCAAALH